MDDKMRLTSFRGNRFNVLFLLSALIFYYHQSREEFLKYNDSNLLLKAVLADVKVPAFVSGCKALGLIDTLITAPLWRILEAEGNVLEMNNNFQTLLQFLERNSEDASSFMTRYWLYY